MVHYNIPGLIISSVVCTVYMLAAVSYDFYGAVGLNVPSIRRPDLHKKELESGKLSRDGQILDEIKRNKYSV